MPDNAPNLISLWFGTTQPIASRRITMWLPFWRAVVKPGFSSARTTSVPDRCGRLGGIRWNFDGGQQRFAIKGQRKFFKIKRRRFLKICQGLLDGFTLRSGTRFRAHGDEFTFLCWHHHGCELDERCSSTLARRLLTKPDAISNAVIGRRTFAVRDEADGR